jgi:hypothetical protein
MTHPSAPPRRPVDRRPVAGHPAVDLHDVVAAGTPAAVVAWLAATRSPRTRADQLADLSDAEVRAVVRLLDPGTARRLLRSLGVLDVRDLLRAVPTATGGGLLAVLDTATADDLVGQLDAEERAAARVALRRARSAAAHGLLAWPAGSVAARMTPDVAAPGSAAPPGTETPTPPGPGATTVPAGTEAVAAAALLRASGAALLVVVDDDRPIGTISASDLADLVDPADPTGPGDAHRTAGPTGARGAGVRAGLRSRVRGLLRRR